ncbi:MAG: VapC toxin family PIN domain ribonuclease [Verrucomicrobia bacterium]|nr:VapC toxin family PIN domain ribonuclease [Verrucomicrobiota bacterium]
MFLLEIQQGICRVKGKDAAFAEILGQWLDGRVKPAFAGRILGVIPPEAERASRIAALRTPGLADCQIAASALEHDLALVTRNIADFADLDGLELVDPWDPPGI